MEIEEINKKLLQYCTGYELPLEVAKEHFGESFVDITTKIRLRHYSSLRAIVTVNNRFTDIIKDIVIPELKTREIFSGYSTSNISEIYFGSHTGIYDDRQIEIFKVLFESLPDETFIIDLINILQIRPVIIVYFPKIIVTEYITEDLIGSNYTINDMFIEITLDLKGNLMGVFEAVKSSYLYEEWYSRYIHSHLPSLNTNEPYERQSPCTGSGLISSTAGTLATISTNLASGIYDTEYIYNIWRLFYTQIEDFFAIESKLGGPYKYLAEISQSVFGNFKELPKPTDYPPTLATYDRCIPNEITNYLGEFLLKVFKESPDFPLLSFISDQVVINSTFEEFILYISRKFIEMYNSHYTVDPPSIDLLLQYKVLCTAMFKGGLLNIATAYVKDHQSEYQEIVGSLIGTGIIRFKGQNITLKVSEPRIIQMPDTFYVLDPRLCIVILRQILIQINLSNEESTNFRETVKTI